MKLMSTSPTAPKRQAKKNMKEGVKEMINAERGLILNVCHHLTQYKEKKKPNQS